MSHCALEKESPSDLESIEPTEDLFVDFTGSELFDTSEIRPGDFVGIVSHDIMSFALSEETSSENDTESTEQENN